MLCDLYLPLHALTSTFQLPRQPVPLCTARAQALPSSKTSAHFIYLQVRSIDVHLVFHCGLSCGHKSRSKWSMFQVNRRKGRKPTISGTLPCNGSSLDMKIEQRNGPQQCGRVPIPGSLLSQDRKDPGQTSFTMSPASALLPSPDVGMAQL